MDKSFIKFIDLIYIKGYFEKGFVNSDEFEDKPFFVLNLLKGSVANPDSINFTKSAINGYISGNSIDSIVHDLQNAGYDNELLAKYIEGLYELNHKDTKTFNDRFGNKLYKEALYEKVKRKCPEIKIEGMTSYLVARFDEIIGDVKYKKANTVLKKSDEDIKANIIDSYTLSESEKKAITNVCKQISDSVNKLLTLSRRGSGLHNMIQREVNDEEWKSELCRSLSEQTNTCKNEYIILQKHCKALVGIIKSKTDIHTSINCLFEIANNICDTEYLFNNDKFHYDEFSNMLKELKAALKSFLDVFESL